MQMISPITNAWDSDATYPKLEVERAWLYEPETEWTYSHHPFLTFYLGRYVAMWSNGRVDEDGPGQRVLAATSPDFRQWTEPAPLVDARMGEQTELVLTPAGFHQHDGRLIVYVGEYEYDPGVLIDGRRQCSPEGHRNTRLWAMTTTDLAAWSGPIDLGLAMIPNYGPEPTASGRLIISGNVAFPHTDDPAGLDGWTMACIGASGAVDGLIDDSETFHQIAERAGWPVKLCEGSWYQTDDGVIHMLLRSGTDRLWVTESADDGEAWSEPVATDFTNGVSKFHCRRLPDGRFYCVGNPAPKPWHSRNPLAVSMSLDGARFDDHRILADEHCEQKVEGTHKGGDYGYPHTLLHDGHLCVIISRQKEAVEVLRVSLEQLQPSGSEE